MNTALAVASAMALGDFSNSELAALKAALSLEVNSRRDAGTFK